MMIYLSYFSQEEGRLTSVCRVSCDIVWAAHSISSGGGGCGRQAAGSGAMGTTIISEE